MADQFHTEGYIKEIKVDGHGSSVKLDPLEKFSFGEGESNAKKIILLGKDSEDKAELVAQSVEFEFENGGIKETFDASFLFALKKDRAKLRVSVKVSNPAPATDPKTPGSVSDAEPSVPTITPPSTDEHSEKKDSKTSYTITSITIL